MANEFPVMSLLEWMSNACGCTFLSDLCFLQKWEKVRLAHRLEQIPPDRISLREWNDALQYLAGALPEKTQQAAREALLRALTHSFEESEQAEKEERT